MPKAMYGYTPLGAFEHHFEEVPILWKKVAADVCWFGGYVDATVEVTYHGRNWHISAVWVTVDNGKTGARCRLSHMYITPKDDPNLYTMLVDSIIEHASARIEELVEDELLEEAA